MSPNLHSPAATVAAQRLGANDLRRVIHALCDAAGAAVEPDFPARIFPVLQGLADADHASFQEVTGSGEGEIVRVAATHPAYLERVIRSPDRARVSARPFWNPGADHSGGRWWRESDRFTPGEFRKHPFHREVLAEVGFRHLMQVRFDGPSGWVLLRVYRTRPCPFSTRERDRLTVLQPHLEKAYQENYSAHLSRLSAGQRMKRVCPTLTRRQAEVLDWLSEGKSNAVIAQLLGIGCDAVKAHLRAIYLKLGVEDRFAAALMARHLGTQAARGTGGRQVIAEGSRAIALRPC